MKEEQLPRDQRGEKPSWRGKWENAISGKQLDNVQEETLVAPVISKHPETDAARDKKNKRSLPHQKPWHRLTKSYPPRVQATEKRILLELEADFRAEISSKESARTRHVIIGTLPSVLITCMKHDAHMAKSADSDMLRLMGSPAKKSKKSGGKGSVALMKKFIQLGCVSHDSHPRKFYSLDRWTIGNNTNRQILHGHMAPQKKYRKERVHR